MFNHQREKMDFDSASMTPPSSPILGYSGSRFNESCAVSGLLYCFTCKGQVRSHDHSFSPDGYILRREVISAIKILSSSIASLNSNNLHQLRLNKFFGRNWDTTNILQLKELVCFIRKNIATLDNLSDPSFSYGISRTTLDSEDEPDPWILRKDVCLFLNDVVSRMIYYRDKLTDTDIEDLFGGLRKSLAKVANWPGSLKSHCGFRDGNSCPSAVYHLFHLNLEIRWSLFIIYAMKPSILDWIFEDLINLAWFKFKYSTDAEQSLIAKHPFNCYCVKEFWTMLRLVLDKLRPREKDFWDIFISSLTKFTSSTETDIFFPIWLIVHIAPLSDYSLCGVYSPDAEKEEISNQNSILSLNPICYDSVNQILRDWSSKGGKVTEMMQLTSLLLPHWGSDITVALTFFNNWLPRIDKTFECKFSNFDVYKSSERWLSLIRRICSPFTKGQDLEDEDDTFAKHIASDSFLSFIRLVVGHVQMCSEKNWRKLKSSICLKLDKRTVSKFSEIGLLRTTTLYLSLAFSSSDTLSLCERMADALKEAKNGQKTVILASTTMYLLLLQKSINVTSISEDFLRTVNDLMSQSITDSIKKDLIMIYLNLLECLPSPVTPSFSADNLGRASLISPNLTMWLVNCGSNYLTRTLRVLTKLTSWIISSHNVISEEKDQLTIAIFNRTAHFLCQTASQNQNRIPSTDVEPLASLAADLTILSRIKNIGEHQEHGAKLFDSFAMYEQTCPEVSQIYVSKLLGCSVPEELSDKVLGFGGQGHVHDNEKLLRLFCSKDVNRKEVQAILTPVVALVKSAVNAVFKDPIVVASIVKTCAILTKHLKFENIYLRGVQDSFLHEVLMHFFPPVQSSMPWDKLPIAVVNPLKNYMLDFCTTIMSQGMFSQDLFLQRKVRDIVNFSFLGFSDKSDNPGLKIMQYACENNSEFILKDIIPSFRSLISDLKSTIAVALADRFIKGVTLCGHNRLWKILLHSLQIIIYIFINQNADPSNQITNIVKRCCIMNELTARPQVKSAFEGELDLHFAFKSKRFYDLFENMFRQKPPSPQLVQFFKECLVPLVEDQIILCESKRSIGRDNFLRQPLEKLKRDIS